MEHCQAIKCNKVLTQAMNLKNTVLCEKRETQISSYCTLDKNSRKCKLIYGDINKSMVTKNGGQGRIKKGEKEGLQKGSRKHMMVMDMFIFWLCGDGFMNIHIYQNLSSCTL